MSEEIYYPKEVEDQPLGDYEGGGGDTVNKSYSTEVYKPITELEKKFPSLAIAYEVISKTLDTRIKKIKGQFTFSKEGAIKVGEYVQGESGEIDISPNGLLGINVNGEQTFLIDATTGDVYFKGTLEAGTILAADNNIIMERGSNGGRTTYYNNGIPVIVIGDPS